MSPSLEYRSVSGAGFPSTRPLGTIRPRSLCIVLAVSFLMSLASCRRPVTSGADCAALIPRDSAPDYVQECSDHEGPLAPWHVCITRTKGSRSKDVLFYFHGYSNDQCAWLASPRPGSDFRAGVAGWWKENGVDAPAVVVFSLGRRFLLTPGGGRFPVSWFVDSVLPEIRKKLGPKEGDYIIWGTSMGGLNALELYLSNPGLWDRALLNSPMIPICDPYAEDGGTGCIRGITTPQIGFLTFESLKLVREFYPTAEAWNGADPLKAAPRLLGPGYPPLLIEIGIADEFGFYPGTDAFRKIASDKGVSVEYIVHGVKGGPFWKVPNHLYVDTGRFAAFIAGVEDGL